MKRRRRFELLLEDLRRRLAHRTRPKGDDALPSAVRGRINFEEALTQDPAKVRQLTEFAQALRSSDAIGRQVAEERLMDNFNYLAGLCLERLEATGFQRVPAFPPPHEVTSAGQPVLQVLSELHQFALTCFVFRRPRDSFGGHSRVGDTVTTGPRRLATEMSGVVTRPHRTAGREPWRTGAASRCSRRSACRRRLARSASAALRLRFLRPATAPTTPGMQGVLIRVTTCLLDQQLRRLQRDFLKEGGLRERMTRARLAARNRQQRGGP